MIEGAVQLISRPVLLLILRHTKGLEVSEMLVAGLFIFSALVDQFLELLHLACELLYQCIIVLFQRQRRRQMLRCLLG